MDNPQTRLWTKPFVLLCLSAFFFFTAHHAVYSTLALYFHEQKLAGFIASQGLIIATFTVASIFTRPFAGAICDGLYNSQKTWLLIVISGILFSITSLGYIFVSNNLGAMLTVRVFHGAGMGFFYTSISVILAKLVPPQRKAEGMSHFGNAIKFAMFLGPPLGIALVNDSHFSFLVFFASAVLALVAVILILDSTRKMDFSSATYQKKEQSKFYKRFFSKSAIIPGITMGANSIAFGCLTPFIPLIADHKAIPDAAKWYYIVYGVTLILSRGLFGKLADRYSKMTTVAPGMFMVAFSLLVIASSNSLLFFLAGSAIYGLAAGVIQPALMAQSIEISNPQEVGRAMATFSMLNDLGIALGSFLMGTLAVHIGITYSLITVAFLVMGGLGFFVLSEKRRQILMPALVEGVHLTELNKN